MTLAPRELYLNDSRYLIMLIDLERPGTEVRLRRELDGWRGFAHAEMLTVDRAALVMKPGGALGRSK